MNAISQKIYFIGCSLDELESAENAVNGPGVTESIKFYALLGIKQRRQELISEIEEIKNKEVPGDWEEIAVKSLVNLSFGDTALYDSEMLGLVKLLVNRVRARGISTVFQIINRGEV